MPVPEKGKEKGTSPTNSQEEGANTEKNLNPQKTPEEGITIDKTGETQKFGETPYRWYVMVAYCLCVFANGFQWVTFSAIAVDFSEHYNEPSWRVNMFSLIYMIIYPFVCIPQGWLIDNYSTRLGIIIASGCTLAGSALKMLVNKDTTLAACFVGQFLSGLFQPALLNSPGKIAANWFREDIRTVICTICCLADTVGIFVGFLWNLAFIKENATQDEFKDQVFKYMLSEFILNLVFCLPAFFIFKDKPDIPPSPSQAEDNSEKPDLIKSLKMLFTNIRFIYLLIATLFVVGYYDVMGTIINSLFDMYGVTGQQSSVIYAVSSVAGMISSLVISWLLDKYKKFKLFMIILCLLGTLFQALFTLLLELVESRNLNAYAIGLVLYTLVNMIVVPFYTIGMNYACEITYPVGESINGGIMMTMSQLSGIGGTFLCDHFINNYKEKPWISNVILLIFFVISCVFVFLFDEKLDRQEVEQAGRIKEDEDKKIEPVTVEVQGQSN
jgi:FLVCR family feline leukemia virus subgroup C receptor-related protein